MDLLSDNSPTLSFTWDSSMKLVRDIQRGTEFYGCRARAEEAAFSREKYWQTV